MLRQKFLRSVRSMTLPSVAGLGSLAILAAIALMASVRQTTLLGEGGSTAVYRGAEQSMMPQMAMQMGSRLQQLREMETSDKTVQALEEQERALKAKIQKVAQAKEDAEHIYDAELKAREENKARHAMEAQEATAVAVKRNALLHGLQWQPLMGTDISFINTADFPASMKGAWHHNAPFGEDEQALLPALNGGLAPVLSTAHSEGPDFYNNMEAPQAEALPASPTAADAAIKLAVKEKVDLDAARAEARAARAEIKLLKDKLSDVKSQQLEKSSTTEHSRLATLDKVKNVAKRALAPKQGQELRMLRKVPAPDKFQQAIKKFLGKSFLVNGVGLPADPWPAVGVTAGKAAAAAAAHGAPIARRAAVKGKVVEGHQKSLFDYNLDPSADPGEDVWPYKAGAAMGSPCSVPGACNHHAEGEGWQLQDDAHYAKRMYKRFDEPEEEVPLDEKVELGDSQVGGYFDDYVPPDDAYAHSLMTSSGALFPNSLDHFGHLAPNSKANIDLMYGPSWHATVDRTLENHKLHSQGRGALSSTQQEEDEADEDGDADGQFYHDHYPTVRLGEDQLGAADEEVPTGLSMPSMPGFEGDHFDHWTYNDPKNQELLNGAYYKDLDRDGFGDRFTPAAEAYARQKGASHDRTLSDHFLTVPHYYGFDKAGGIEAQKQEDYGGADGTEDYQDKVFTGTDEKIEDHKGTSGSAKYYPDDEQPPHVHYLKTKTETQLRQPLPGHTVAAASTAAASATAAAASATAVPAELTAVRKLMDKAVRLEKAADGGAAKLGKAAEEKAHRAHRVAAAPAAAVPAPAAPAAPAEPTVEEEELEAAHHQIKALEHQLYKKAKKASVGL